MRQKLVKILKPLDAVSVENSVGPGTPDINFGGNWEYESPVTLRVGDGTMSGKRWMHISGWIECKWDKAWPVRGGPLRVPHYTPQQKVWARRRCHRGGNCWLMLQVGVDWILLDGAIAALHLGNSTREELIDLSLQTWTNPPPSEELIKCLGRT